MFNWLKNCFKKKQSLMAPCWMEDFPSVYAFDLSNEFISIVAIERGVRNKKVQTIISYLNKSRPDEDIQEFLLEMSGKQHFEFVQEYKCLQAER